MVNDHLNRHEKDCDKIQYFFMNKHKKMVNISSQQRNISQNHNVIHFTLTIVDNKNKKDKS